MNYFDTSYLARLYLEDKGWEKVRRLGVADHIACSIIGRAECVAAFHRKFREGAITSADLRILLEQFGKDCSAGAVRWLSLSERVIARLETVYPSLPGTVHLRSADGIHLSTAAENGLLQVYSNDTRLLDAAQYFGVQGVNII